MTHGWQKLGSPIVTTSFVHTDNLTLLMLYTERGHSAPWRGSGEGQATKARQSPHWCTSRDHALQARKAIAALREREPSVEIATPARAEKRTASRFYQLKSERVLEEHEEQTGRPLLVVRPGELQWYSPDERPPLQALLEVERPTGGDVGEAQRGNEEGEAEVARGRGG